MKLFKIAMVFGLIISSHLSAAEFEDTKTPSPHVLRGIRVAGEERVELKGSFGDQPIYLRRIIEGKFGFFLSSMDWSTYRFEKPRGVFWTEQATQQVLATKNLGVRLDFNPEDNGFVLNEETLKNLTISAGDFSISLYEALLKYKFDENNILVIKN